MHKQRLLQKKLSNFIFEDIIFVDDNRIIKIPSEIMKTIISYVQINKHSKEAGGILLGREDISTNNLTIDVFTEPFQKDKRSRFSFDRLDEKHIKFFNEINKTNGNIYFYVGEWHTHPEEIPHYSNIDSDNWNKINKENSTVSFQYQMIVGSEKLRIWKVIENDINLVYEVGF